MVTYNVKTAAAIIGKSQVAVIERAKKLGFTKPWVFTADELDSIRTLGRTKHYRLRVTKLRMMAGLINLPEGTLKNILRRTGLTLSDYDKLMEACRLYKTGYYTWKGIRKRLGIKESDL
jgi:hypothetical protein